MTFDAEDIARHALEHGEDPLHSVVGQLAGFASVCWENMSGTGVFQSEDCRQATDAAIKWLQENTVVKVEPGQRLVLVTNPDLTAEAAEHLRSAVAESHGGMLVINREILKDAYVVPVAGGVGVREAGTETGTCPAVLNIAGEHFPCQQMEQMVEGSTSHEGWAHSNRDAQAIWEG